jgi:hypothetical protein
MDKDSTVWRFLLPWLKKERNRGGFLELMNEARRPVQGPGKSKRETKIRRL